MSHAGNALGNINEARGRRMLQRAGFQGLNPPTSVPPNSRGHAEDALEIRRYALHCLNHAPLDVRDKVNYGLGLSSSHEIKMPTRLDKRGRYRIFAVYLDGTREVIDVSKYLAPEDFYRERQ